MLDETAKMRNAVTWSGLFEKYRSIFLNRKINGAIVCKEGTVESVIVGGE